ncbi:hypothetical protein [Methylosinus sp. LW4]|uniref:hypothetical protein n=1 Tax=Methylosinus sp. LW4 TaxID=136993 RepID=UPI000362C743|nr:hypothetical protein [Methylosinus sp. LW4]
MSKVSRRAFLGATATVAGAAALPTAAAAEQIASLAGVAPLKPISEYPFRWWVSFDGGEVFTEDFKTREEAIAYAEASGGGTIAECQQRDFDLYLTDDDIFEALHGHNEDAIGEGEFIEWTAEQGRELEREVNAVIAAWAERHKINSTAWQFAAVRNSEKIEGLPKRSPFVENSREPEPRG